MTPQYTIAALVGAAAGVGALHTLLAPQHYLPFVALGEAQKWSSSRTMFVTFICGMAHMLSSAIVGTVGIILGAGIGAVESFDETKSDIVKWAFLLFAILYTAYGVRLGLKGEAHCRCAGGHSDISAARVDFWALFLIFALGPCEILIPLVMYPAAHSDWLGVILVVFAFSGATVVTMLAVVFLLLKGLRALPVKLEAAERWNHAITGVILIACAGLLFAHEFFHVH